MLTEVLGVTSKCFLEKIISQANNALISEGNVFHNLGAATWNDLTPRMS